MVNATICPANDRHLQDFEHVWKPVLEAINSPDQYWDWQRFFENLARKLAKTGNIMDGCNGPKGLQSIANEAGAVEVGQAIQGYVQAVQQISTNRMQQLEQEVRTQSILFNRLCHYAIEQSQNWIRRQNILESAQAVYDVK